MQLLADAAPLVALLDRRDPDHGLTAEWFASVPLPLPIVELVVAEAAYFLGKRPGPAGEVLLARLFADGDLVAISTEAKDWARIGELAELYLDLPLGISDAAVVAIAERLGITTIATFDHRHFGVVRPRHCDAFELVP